MSSPDEDASMHTITIHTSKLFDSKNKYFEENISLQVDTRNGLIARVYKRPSSAIEDVSGENTDIDLRHLTVFPGFVDAHTHIFLHAYAETPAINQMRDESFVERIIRATNHCRAALMAGYTTYRDLGTEGLGDADAHLRNVVNRGLIPGPRLFVATEAIASSGGYEIRQENGPGTSVPRISDVSDGPWGARAAVRRRLGAGADVIKFYADYRKRALRFPSDSWPGAASIQFPPGGVGLANERNPNVLLFTQEEMDAIVAEAKMAKAPVAAHASCPKGIQMAVKAGVTTIEHGYETCENDTAFRLMHEKGTIFVPTLAVLELFYPRGGPFETILRRTKDAFEEDVKLACGGDTGPFTHGDNAREMELMAEAGVPAPDVLQAATLHGWEACGGDWCGRKFGRLAESWAADIVALDGDPTEDLKALRKVSFVMKDGKVWKRDGAAVNIP